MSKCPAPIEYVPGEISDDRPFRVMDLGRVPFNSADTLQRQMHGRIASGDDPPTVLRLEHEPVITVGRRGNVDDHILASTQRLIEMGINLVRTDRGGDVTYHGPGQLVVWPLVSLTDLKLSIGAYMRQLEQAVIDTLARYDVRGYRDDCATGVWTDAGKVCALGVRVRQGVTLHGLALNVCPTMSHFETIVPCGLTGRSVTCLDDLLGERAPTMAQVGDDLIEVLSAMWRTER